MGFTAKLGHVLRTLMQGSVPGSGVSTQEDDALRESFFNTPSEPVSTSMTYDPQEENNISNSLE